MKEGLAGRGKLTFYFITVALFIGWFVPILLAPICKHEGYQGAARFIYLSYHKFCHQLPARSFRLLEHQLAVCHRCAGIYLGLILGALLYPLLFDLGRTNSPDRKYLIFMSTPIALDLFLPLIGWWENTMVTRFSTGLIFGVTIAFYALPGFCDLGEKLKYLRGQKTAVRTRNSEFRTQT